MTAASAPHDCSFCVVSQCVVICSSAPTEPISVDLWIMLDLARSTAKLLAHFEKWGMKPPIQAEGSAVGGSHPQS